ncbi:hypothetical protein ElyMa_003761900 [Elysia marginata]|uniref:Uncharacterized protein n=1 Tax=Elysia marginata TaxID=1093978 RepID=A0AAV4F9H7_9GAST|nr:hypothetical protein ElyMa_003761900 [Elysia marginata]
MLSPLRAEKKAISAATRGSSSINNRQRQKTHNGLQAQLIMNSTKKSTRIKLEGWLRPQFGHTSSLPSPDEDVDTARDAYYQLGQRY